MFDKYNKTDHYAKASEILLMLGQNVSAQDKKDATQELGFSNVTIGSYLSGKVRDLDTAEKLIVFFRAKVNQRELVLSGNNG